MKPPNLEKYSGHFRYLFIALVYVIVCLIVLNTSMDLNGFRGDSERFGFNRMMTYSAEKPFCYRVLTPLIVNGIVSIIPQSAINSLEKDLLVDSDLLRYVRVTDGWDTTASAKYHIAYFYLFPCLLITIVLLRRLTRIVYNPSPAMLDLAPALAMILLPMSFLHGGYMYDFPELMFFVAAIVLIMQSRWWLYYLILPLAVLNKETGFLIILYFTALKYREMPKGAFWGHLAVQLIITLPILLVIRYIFAGNPDPAHPVRIVTNLLFWINPLSYFKFYEIYAPLLGVPRGGNIISLFLVGFAVLYGWKVKPSDIKRLLLYSLIVMIPLFLMFGNRDELRGLALLFPPIYLLGIDTLQRIYGSLRK